MTGGTLLDRVTGLFFLALGIFAMWHAYSLDVAFSSDPVGPKVFPLIIGGIMAVSGAVLAVTAGAVDWEGGRWRRVVVVAVAALIYPLLLVPLGFIIATSLLSVVVALALNGRPVQSVISAIVTSAVIFLIIDTALGLPLPTGPLGF